MVVGNRGVQNGALVVDSGAPLAAAAEPGASTTAHDTEVRDYLTSPELCGTCHVVHGPGLFEEVTLDELRASADPERTCAGCHMPKLPSGGADHRFTGVDPAWGAEAGAAERAASESAALLARAVTLELLDGESGIEVRLTNTGGGHSVPTGVAFLRDFWVEMFHSSTRRGSSSSFPARSSFGARMTYAGEEVDLPTDADAIEARVLAPEASVTAPIAVPLEATPPIAIDATFRARAVSSRAMVALGLGARAAEVPELSIVSVTR